MTQPPLFGLLVGGQGSRMGGVAKGLLRTSSGDTIIQRLSASCLCVVPNARVLLLGSHAAYADCGLPILPDNPQGVGPLGGLRALLDSALSANQDAIVLGCDLPYLSVALLARLVEHPAAAAVSARLDARWNPVFARYTPALALPVVDARLAQNRLSMHGVLDELGAAELSLNESEKAELRDWDTPADMASG